MILTTKGAYASFFVFSGACENFIKEEGIPMIYVE